MQRLKARASEDEHRYRELSQRISDVGQEHTARQVQFQRRLDESERESLRIDARGLPVVAVGVVLTSIPDLIAESVVGSWLVAICGLAFTGAMVILTVRERS